MGLPHSVTIDIFLTWAQESGFTEMPRHSVRRRLITRGGRRLASFTFRARGPEGPNTCTLLDLPASATTDGQQISIEPFPPCGPLQPRHRPRSV